MDKLENLSYYKDKQILDCPLCEKPLTLLFQFKSSMDIFKDKYDKSFVCLNNEDVCMYSQIYALFYYEKHPELMTCFIIDD